MPPGSQILTLFLTKKCHFPHPFSDQTSKIHSRFQTWPLGRNYMLSLLRLERKQKIYSNPFRICIFLFLSYSFGIETINTLIRSCSLLKKTIHDSRPKWARGTLGFRPKRRKNQTRLRVTHTCVAYIREYPPPPPGVKGSQPPLQRNHGHDSFQISKALF